MLCPPNGSQKSYQSGINLNFYFSTDDMKLRLEQIIVLCKRREQIGLSP